MVCRRLTTEGLHAAKQPIQEQSTIACCIIFCFFKLHSYDTIFPGLKH
uniref:Uncharacterized protein n=1 Tax=Setaria italica TaxID=4555 RepID=K3Z227_SETIT